MGLAHDPEVWRARLAALPLATYEAGETVFAEGTKTGRLLILKSGAVAIVKGDTEIATRSPNPARCSASCRRCSTSRTVPTCARWKRRSFTAMNAPLGPVDRGSCQPREQYYVTMMLARRLDGANQMFLELKNQLATGEPPGLIDATLDKIEGLLSAIGTGYIRAGAGYSGYPFT
jgi:hypothetical protein